MELYPVISQDPRFHALLGQPGSTPLDLFKFYVEELKARFHDEKKIIKEILKEKEFDMSAATGFEEFATIVCEDKRSASLDAGNVKLTYNALLEKAEAKDKEIRKIEDKKLRKLEVELRALFQEVKVEDHSSWADVRILIADREAAMAVTDTQAEKMFRDYVKDLGETCLHNHGKRKSKKSKKKKKASSSDSESEQEQERRRSRKRSKKESESLSESDSDSDYHKKKKKKKKSKARARSASESRSDISEDSSYGKKTKKKGRGTPSLSPSPARRAASPAQSPVRRKTRDSFEDKRRGRSSEESIEEGELSEDELERKRIQLLKQLQEDD